jgi:hypothetical protein
MCYLHGPLAGYARLLDDAIGQRPGGQATDCLPLSQQPEGNALPHWSLTPSGVLVVQPLNHRS